MSTGKGETCQGKMDIGTRARVLENIMSWFSLSHALIAALWLLNYTYRNYFKS